MAWDIESSPEIGYWVSEQLGSVYCPKGSNAIGLRKDNEIIAGVIYENWNGRSVMVHIAVKGRLTPAYIAAIFDYPYNVCGVEKVIAPIEVGNVRSSGLVENMGFREEARLKDCHPNGDIVIYSLTKANCRFLEDRYGKKVTHPAPRP